MIRVVIDTNVLVAALRSSSGASHQILLAADAGRFEFALSVPLLAEYDDVTRRSSSGVGLPPEAVEAIIGRMAAICHQQQIYFLWRPLLQDPKDDMVLEVAIASGASHIITFNRKDLEPASQFGIIVVTPSQFLALLT